MYEYRNFCSFYLFIQYTGFASEYKAEVIISESVTLTP